MLAVATRKRPLLISSFRTWRSHQPSNSSHDLIAAMQNSRQLPKQTIWLSQLPVNFEIAPIRVINAMYLFYPRAIVCCGMAENRAYLSLEQQAKGPSQSLQTLFDLPSLLAETHITEISNDAGSYVCNALYYQVLKTIQENSLAIPCLFIHVPLLKASSRFYRESTASLIQADMVSVINKIYS